MTAALLADFKTEPYLHQLREFELHCEDRARALLWQMRTGKTKAVIDTACHLYREGRIDTVVVIAPNGVHENWLRRELPVHHWDSLAHCELVWRSSEASRTTESRDLLGADWKARNEAWWEKCVEMLSDGGENLCWFAFNSESIIRKEVRSILRRMRSRGRRMLLVVDESDDFRKPGSKRSQMMRAFSKYVDYTRILTGTVVTNSPLHAWAQFELLQPGALGFKKYSEFEGSYATFDTRKTKNGRRYEVVSAYHNLEDLRDRMGKWSSVVLRSDCEDLPEVVREVRRIPLSDVQRRLYEELRTEFRVTVGGREVSIGENTMRLIKLQQIVSGWLKDEWGDIHALDGRNVRLDILSDEVYLAPGKVIVWCHFKHDIALVKKRLTEDGHRTVEYHGGVGDEAKQRAIDDFQNDPEVKCFVGQPLSGGRGLNLSSADDVINYSHTFNAIARQQSSERATAMMGSNVRLVDFVAHGVDGYILDAVMNNIDVADFVAGHGLHEAMRRCAL